jgi:probable HAF family extracellular repeat protein
MKRSLCGFVLLGLLLGGAGQAEADYIFTTLPDLPGAMNNSISFTGINNVGQIVGYYTEPNYDEHGFLLSGGKYTSFDVPAGLTEPYPGVVGTYPMAINDHGQIVGYTYSNIRPPPEPPAVGFLFNSSGGNYTTIVANNPFSTYTSTGPNGINNAGQIVGGYATDERGPTHGFLLSGGSYTTIDVPGSVNGPFTGTTIAAINNAGQMLVNSSLGSFLLSGGTYTPLNVPAIPLGLMTPTRLSACLLMIRMASC